MQFIKLEICNLYSLKCAQQAHAAKIQKIVRTWVKVLLKNPCALNFLSPCPACGAYLRSSVLSTLRKVPIIFFVFVTYSQSMEGL